MKRILSLLLILIVPLLAGARSDLNDSMNTERFWQTIAFRDYKSERLQNKKLVLPEADTMFIVASNRHLQTEQARFMSEERGEDHINYFLVFQKNGHWNVWRTSFKSAVKAMSARNRDWIVYTEGFGKIFTTGMYRGMNMAAQYKVNVLYLDYPSFNTSKKMMGNYYFALDNARQSGEDFAPVFDTIKQYRETGKMGTGHLTLFFHSMGNNMIREMVRHNRIDAINDAKWVDNIVLNSACVPQKDHAQWVAQLRFAERIYINYNPKDATLSGANFMSLKKQLGQRQFSHQSPNAIYVNFNGLCNRNHSNFLQLLDHRPAAPAALAYYNVLFHGECVTLEDGRCFRANAEHKADYTILDAMPEQVLNEPPQKTAQKKNVIKSTDRAANGNTSTMLH